MGSSNQKTTMLIRLRKDELQAIDDAAAACGMTRSEYVRKRCAHNGEDLFSLLARKDKAFREAQEAAEAKRKRRMDDHAPTNEHTRKSSFPATLPLRGYEDHLHNRVTVTPQRSINDAPKINHVGLRVTDYEWKALHYRAERASMTVTDFILAKSVYEKNGFGATEISVSKEVLEAIQDELRKQGVNLNQIARGVNLLKEIAPRPDVDPKVIKQLTHNIQQDNDATRSLLNAALTKVLDALALRELKRR